MVEIDLHAISYTKGNRSLFLDASFSFSGNGIYMISGENGVGKTTLLHLIHGLYKPEKGLIHLSGFSKKNPYFAMVFQNPMMLNRSTKDNINFALRMSKNTKSAMSYLKEFDLDEFSALLARKLSLGQQQRLAIARAFAFTPQVLLLDEPTASLDKSSTTLVEEKIQDYAKNNLVLMVSHDSEQIKRLSHQQLQIKNKLILPC